MIHVVNMNRSTRTAVLGIALCLTYAVPTLSLPVSAHAAAKKKVKKGKKKGAKDEPPAVVAEEPAQPAPEATEATPAPPPEAQPAPAPPEPTPEPEPAPAPAPAEATPPTQQPPPAPPTPRDHARFRGGFALEGGAIIAPGIITLGLAGAQGQLGVQINNLVGIYVVPGFDICFGPLGGINIGSALMVDFTFASNFLTVGVGPNVSFFAAIGLQPSGASASAGALYGGRVHLAVNLGGLGDDGVRRKAFVIGMDANLMFGAVGFTSAGSGGATAAGALQFVLEPILTLGYQAF
jgi:hypothetical protein